MTPSQLKAWREQNGYSQGQLAIILQVDVTTISRWERGVRDIPPFLHLALECVEKKGGEPRVSKGSKKTYQYPVPEEKVYIADAKKSWGMRASKKTKTKKEV